MSRYATLRRLSDDNRLLSWHVAIGNIGRELFIVEEKDSGLDLAAPQAVQLASVRSLAHIPIGFTRSDDDAFESDPALARVQFA